MLRLCFLFAFFLAANSAVSHGLYAQGAVDPTEWHKIHQQEVRKWAAKIGFSFGRTRSLLEAAVPEDVDQEGNNAYFIQNIDPVSLASRDQILVSLIAPGTSHGLSVYVIGARQPYERIWSALGADEDGSCPAEAFGTESMLGEPTASADPDGHIFVKIPRWKSPNVRQNAILIVVTYRWTRKTYRVESERIFSEYNWNGSDYVARGPGKIRQCDRPGP
jgi:hypothetical protein